MNKLKKVELVVEILVVTLLTLCMLYVPVEKGANFWISFVCVVLSMLMYVVVLHMRKKKDDFLYMIMPIVTLFVSIIQMAWNVFVVCAEFVRLETLYQMQGLSIFKGTWFQEVPLKQMVKIVSTMTNSDISQAKVITISVPVNLIVNLLLWGVYIGISYAAMYGIYEIQKQRNEVKQSIQFMKRLEDDLSVLVMKNKTTSNIKLLEQLFEKVKYSDPTSNEYTVGVETQITEKMLLLKENLNIGESASASQIINDLEQLIDERNIYCKRGK